MSNRDHTPFFIVATIIVAAGLGMLAAAVHEKYKAEQSEVEPPALSETPRGRSYQVSYSVRQTLEATDFYDNHGRMCTLARLGANVALDCDPLVEP